MRALKFLFEHLNRFRLQFFAITFIGLLEGTVGFFIPVGIAEFTKNSFSLKHFLSLALTLIALYAISLFLQWILRRYGESLGPKYSLFLRERYFQALETLPLKRLVNQHSGYTLSLINNVTGGIAGLSTEILWGLTGLISTLTLFFYFTARESILIACVNGFVLFAFVAISAVLAKQMVFLAKETNESGARLMQGYVDFMGNILTVIKLGIQTFAEQSIKERTKHYTHYLERLQAFHAARWLGLHALFAAMFLATICFLLFQILKGQAPVAVLIIFLSALSALRKNMERLAENFKTVIELDAYIESLNNIVTITPPKVSLPSSHSWNEIHFDDVQFHYPEQAVSICVPDFTLQGGDKILITGASGQGKTTFLHLLANFYQPQTGTRTVDGDSYETLGEDFFRKRFTLVSQEVELFHMSLRENICLGTTRTDEELEELLTRVEMHSWISELEAGLNSAVGEKGVKVSSGQKQRINILRAFVLNREVVLLDEPTSHMDKETESKVSLFLEEMLKDKTAIIVSHRESLFSFCNKRYSMQSHKLLQGTL